MATYSFYNFIKEPLKTDRLMYIYKKEPDIVPVNSNNQYVMNIDPFSSTFTREYRYIHIISDGVIIKKLDFPNENEAVLALSKLNYIKSIFCDRINNIVNDCIGIYSTGDTYNTGETYSKIEADNRFVHLTGDETIFGNKIFEDNISINGDLNVYGTTTTVNTENLQIKDNLIVINSGETGNGVSNLYAGIQVDRGTKDDYYFLFDETQDNFRIGEGSGNTQAVSTREDSPINNGIAYWNNSENRFDTNSNLITDGNNLSATTFVGNLSWNYITNAPTTLSGYSITDAYTQDEVDNLIDDNSGISNLDGGLSNSIYGGVMESPIDGGNSLSFKN